MPKLIWMAVLIFSSQAFAVQVNLDKWNELEQSMAQMEQPSLTETGMEASIASSKLSLQDIMATRYFMMRLMQQNLLSPEQVSWLQTQQTSQLIVTAVSPEHPRKELILFDVSKAATAVLDSFADKQHAHALWRNWYANNMDSTGLETLVKQSKRIQRLVLGQMDRQSRHLLNSILLNQVSSIRAYKGKDIGRFQFLMYQQLTEYPNAELAMEFIQFPVSEYSYQFLQKLPNLFSEKQTKLLLMASSKKLMLQSQAHQLLAKRFRADQEVLDFILGQLQADESFWSAVMVLDQFSDTEQRSKVSHAIHQLPPKRRHIVTSQIGWEDLQ